LDPDGNPMAEVSVGLRRLRYPGSYQTETDKEGQYEFTNVRPTAYLIEVEPRTGIQPPKPKPDSVEQRVTWMRTYYPGVSTKAQATPVVVPQGGELQGLDFR